jgi:hypothetical protein
VSPYARVTALVSPIASLVVASPAAAATALISRIASESSVAPNALTTWYRPSFRFDVLCPT